MVARRARAAAPAADPAPPPARARPSGRCRACSSGSDSPAPLPSDTRRLRRPRHPWLLVLQALVVSALVVALAGPRSDRSAEATTVYVLDDSFWMQSGTRLADARNDLVAAVGRRTRTGRRGLGIGDTARCVYRGSRAGVAHATRGLEASERERRSRRRDRPRRRRSSAARADAWSCCARPRTRCPDRARRRDSWPTGSSAGRAATRGSSRRGPAAASAPATRARSSRRCATARRRARVDRYTASVAGRRPVTLPRDGSGALVDRDRAHGPPRLDPPTAPARSRRAADRRHRLGHGARNRQRARRRRRSRSSAIPRRRCPLAQAFASVPGRDAAPAHAEELPRAGTHARASSWCSTARCRRTGLPPAPAVLLIDPPALPDGSVGAPIAAPTISGSAPGSRCSTASI